MAWQTTLRPNEEIVLDNRVIIRKVRGKVEISEVLGAQRVNIVKRLIDEPTAEPR